MIENKYDRFFESVKQFVINTRLSFEDEIAGVSEATIRQFEEEFNIQFPSSLFAFLRVLGKRIKVRRTDDLLCFTLNDINEATSVAQKENYKEIIIRGIGFLNYETDNDLIFYFNKLIDINKVIFITQYHRWLSIGFIDSRYENPIIYHINEKKYYSTDNLNFTNFIRDVLFNAIKPAFDVKSLSDEKINEETDSSKQLLIEIKNLIIINLSWAKPYINHDIFYRPQYKYRKRRLEFYEIINKKEEETGIVMTIDEFEWAFIEHLRGLGVDI